jgi:triosephosphate isomerase
VRKFLVAGNWKMNKDINESVDLARRIVLNTNGINKVDILICPPFTSLAPVYDIIKDSNVKLGAQNMYYQDEGAFTGEIAAKFLKSTGCEFVIIGHSERRKYFNESDKDVNRKIKQALQYDLTPIVCVGETLEQRENGETEDIIKREVTGALKDQKNREKIIFAYEPIWAIGTGKTAKPEDANKIHKIIRNMIKTEFGVDENGIKILYGGSVKPANAASLMSQDDIDGSLIGGASLEAKSFVEIIKTTVNLA